MCVSPTSLSLLFFPIYMYFLHFPSKEVILYSPLSDLCFSLSNMLEGFPYSSCPFPSNSWKDFHRGHRAEALVWPGIRFLYIYVLITILLQLFCWIVLFSLICRRSHFRQKWFWGKCIQSNELVLPVREKKSRLWGDASVSGPVAPHYYVFIHCADWEAGGYGH